MSPHDVELLKLYVLLSPLLVCGLAVGIVLLTGWIDRREQRRQRPAE